MPSRRAQKRRQAVEPCAYCGNITRVTRDHVPPKSWFPAGADQNLLTVPSCAPCNRNWAADAEYMRAAITFDRRSSKNPAARALTDTVFRGLVRHGRGGATGSIARSIREVELVSPAGIYLGKTGAFDPDIDAIERATARMIRALYWREAGRRLEEGFGVGVYVLSAFTPKTEQHRQSVFRLAELATSGQARKVGDVLVYCYRLLDEPGPSAWALQFYGGFHLLAVTTIRDEAHREMPLY